MYKRQEVRERKASAKLDAAAALVQQAAGGAVGKDAAPDEDGKEAAADDAPKTPPSAPSRLASYRQKTPEEVQADLEMKEARADAQRKTLRRASTVKLALAREHEEEVRQRAKESGGGNDTDTDTSGAPTPLRRRDTSNDLKVATIQKTPEGVPTRLASFRQKTPDEVKAESEAKEARALERRMTLRRQSTEKLRAQLERGEEVRERKKSLGGDLDAAAALIQKAAGGAAGPELDEAAALIQKAASGVSVDAAALDAAAALIQGAAAAGNDNPMYNDDPSSDPFSAQRDAAVKIQNIKRGNDGRKAAAAKGKYRAELEAKIKAGQVIDALQATSKARRDAILASIPVLDGKLLRILALEKQEVKALEAAKAAAAEAA